MSWEITIIISIICLLLEGFFSGAEIALISSDKVLLNKKSMAGDKGAKLAQWFLDRPELLLATTLVGTNLCTIVFSTLVTLTVIHHSNAGASGLASILVVGPCILVFGEMIPKTLFQTYADKLVTRVVLPLRLVGIILFPITWTVSFLVRKGTQLFFSTSTRIIVTRSELELLIDDKDLADKETHTDITKNEREMISKLFKLSDDTVEDAMLPLSEIIALDETTTIAEAARTVNDHQHTRIPVFQSRIDQIVGVLHVFDILKTTKNNINNPVSTIIRQPIFVPESKMVLDLFVELQSNGNQMAIVVDEYGGATGIITIEDIIEEIVGEIDDEYDIDNPIYIETDGVSTWKVLGRTPIAQVNHHLDIALPENDDDVYESLGGLLLSELKRIPKEGDQIVFDNICITVLSSSDRAVEQVRITIDAEK